MARKKAAAGGGAPEWLVTFADLMSLLVCFFVLIISFSIQDKEKLQVVAGSMREAFGVKETSKKAGMIELEGVPVRDYVKRIAQAAKENDTDFANDPHNDRRQQGPEANTHTLELADTEQPRQFAAAAASLRQAMQSLPEIADVADQVIMEETPDGLNIQLLDQEGRSMFAPGSKHPYEKTRLILTKMAPILNGLSNRITVTGHTNASKLYERAGYTQWELSADRANAAREILAEGGLATDRFYAVTGKADTEPLFPDNPFLAANERVNILIMSEAPPLPLSHKP